MANVFDKGTAVDALMMKFEKDARAAGLDFLLVMTEPKSSDTRTIYHCEPGTERHVKLTKAIDATYEKLLGWYEDQERKSAKAGK